MSTLKQKDRRPVRGAPHYATMSTKTRVFIQKICYKKAAAVDMTKHGFVNDSKLHPVNMMLKPLRDQLDKIWGKHIQVPSSRKLSPTRKLNDKGSTKPKTVSSKKDDKSKAKRKKTIKIKIQKRKIYTC